jgi:hypothetical protein
MDDLEAVRVAAAAAGAFAPAVRASELQGRHLSMWKNEATSAPSLAELIDDAIAAARKS